MTQNIIEGNRLIAEFMGCFLSAPDAQHYSHPLPDGSTTYDYTMPVDDLRYHHSWSVLMPVVEKTATFNLRKGRLWFEFEIQRSYCHIWSNNGHEFKRNYGTTIEATWHTVVEFITWYNSNKP